MKFPPTFWVLHSVNKQSEMKFPPTFWVLHNVNQQSGAHSLRILIQELMISQFTRKTKVKMKTPFNQMVGRLLTYCLHSNNKGKKKGGPGNIEYDHKHKFISPNHMRRCLIEFSFSSIAAVFHFMITPTDQRPDLDMCGIVPSIGKQYNL